MLNILYGYTFVKKLLNMLNHVYLNHHWNHLLYLFIYWSSIMSSCPQEPWQYQSVFVALPRHESLCCLCSAIVRRCFIRSMPQQNMPKFSEVSTTIVGDFSNENIHHLCYNICTKISKTILHKSLYHYPRNAQATF